MLAVRGVWVAAGNELEDRVGLAAVSNEADHPAITEWEAEAEAEAEAAAETVEGAVETASTNPAETDEWVFDSSEDLEELWGFGAADEVVTSAEGMDHG